MIVLSESLPLILVDRWRSLFLMACNDKNYEVISKNDWLQRMENVQIRRTDMNKLIMNYLVTGIDKEIVLENIHDFKTLFLFYSFIVTEGFKEAAEKFQLESGISPSVDLDTLDDRIKIRDAIQNGHIDEAITLVNQIHPELLDNDRHLYFHLQVHVLR